jgi:hypothetical protein
MLNSVRLKRNCTFKKDFIFRTAKHDGSKKMDSNSNEKH